MSASGPRLGRRLRLRSPSEIGFRARQRIRIWLELFGGGASGSEPSDEALKRSLREECGTLQLSAGESRRTSPVHVTRGRVDGTSAGALAQRRFPHAAASIIDRANRALNDRFDIFGHEGLSYGDPIDWHLDPLRCRRAPLVHWSRVPYLDVERVGDHKVIWELNRHQHLVTLGQAYCLTGDERYASTIVRHVTEWMDANPPKLGINWSSSLELAFRAISWTWALHLARSSEALSPAFMARVLKFVHVHARHISGHLSTYFSPNTHLTGEALGLLYIGSCFDEFRDAGRWRELGWSILEAELQRQVRPDGIYFEQTTWYQRYTADFYLHAIQLREQTGNPVPERVRRQVERLVDALVQFTGPDGLTPLLGDDDGGQLLPLRVAAPSDFRATLAHAAVTLGQGEYASLAGDGASCLPWLVGDAGLTAFDTMGARPPRTTARLFRDGGYFVARDRWASDGDFVVVDCGPHGVHSCGHAHADALSVEFTLGGVPILIDPGTFSYTQPERDEFRATRAHNTITVDGRSSSEPNDQPFRWKTAANCLIVRAMADERLAYLEGEHDGFMRLADPVRHRRTVFAVFGEFLAILDTIEMREAHSITGSLHFSPKLVLSLNPDRAGLSVNAPEISPEPIADVFVLGNAATFEVERGRVAPVYGVSVDAPVAAFTTRQTSTQSYWTIVNARRKGGDEPRIRLASSASSHAVTITTGENEHILIAGEGGVSFDGLASDAKWVWIRRRVGHPQPDEFVLIAGSELTISGTPVVSVPGCRERVHGRSLETGWELRVSPAQ